MGMHVVSVVALLVWKLSLVFPAPVDTVIVQVQQWGVVGAQRIVDQVLLNGVSLTDTSQADSIIRSISSDAHLLTLATLNQTSALRNHTVLRSRECILEGSQLHWTDRVFCDGTVYLTLDHTGVWTAHVPQARALKELWDQQVQRTREERIRLQQGCIKLMRELRLSVEQPGMPFPPFLIPVLAFLVFTGLIVVSLVLFKKLRLRHPGGVLGSVIHYPKDMTEMARGGKGSSYEAL